MVAVFLHVGFFKIAMSIRNLERLFQPASVAVIGASDRPGSVGATVWRNLAAGGFKGPIWPVNRSHGSVGGVAAYVRVADLPSAPGLAVICTPAASVPALIAQLGEAGCRAAVVLSGGMDGRGDNGRSWRSAMLDAARPFLLRILGPNCVGLLVPRLGLNASFAPAAAAPLPGKLAFVSQSGALVTAVLDWAGEQGIGFSCFVSLGDGSDVDFGDLLDYLAGDEHTEAILLYAESVRQARKFMSAARAAARSKPTLIVKASRNPASAKAAFSHTGALAGADLVYDAAIARAGMLRVNSTDALFDAVTTLARTSPPRGERLAILTNGGGPGVMATDALIAGGGSLASLAGGTMEALDRCLPANWSHGNPVDIIGDAPLARYCDALQVLVGATEVDAVLLIHAPTAIVDAGSIAAAVAPLIRAAAAGGCPVYTCWMGGASVAAARRLFSAAGLPLFATPEAAVRAHLQLLAYRRNQQLLMQAPAAVVGAEPQREQARALIAALLAAPAVPAGPAPDRRIGEADTKALLKLYGVEVVATVVSADADSAVHAARQLGYPVAIKLVSPDISHKSAVGGVVLNVEDDAGVRAAVAAIGERLGRLAPQATVTGFTVQQMLRRPGAIELIAGLATDPVFGPVVLFGQGGVAVEALADQVIGLPPLNQVLAADMISRTRSARLLAGGPGRAPADLTAIGAVLIRLGQLAADFAEVLELDINPLLADAAGAVALDARMRLRAAPAAGAVPTDPLARLAILPYPRALERQLVLSALGPLVLRPIRPEDGPAHARFFAALGAEDVRMRLFGAVRALSPSQLARFTQIDYAREMAFIATRRAGDVWETLGVARIVSDPDGVEGEFAIVVRSDIKRMGLGALLFDYLLDYCRHRGLQLVKGIALAENLAMQGLARSRGFDIQHNRAGEVLMQLRL